MYLRDSRLVLLSKSGRSQPKIEQTRGISINSHLTKIIERSIALKNKKMAPNLLKVGRY